MKKTVSIVGGGSSALFLAAFLDPNFFKVTIFEKNKAPGRKFLVAGDGGFNLSHSEFIDDFLERYTPASFLTEAIVENKNTNFTNWLYRIGIKTFVGSSGRIYPEKGIKPIDVLNAIFEELKSNDVSFKFNHTWKGWDSENGLLFENKEVVSSDYTIFALGGGSWSVTGSDGFWLETFKEKGISTFPFVASNCAFGIAWDADFIAKNHGQPLKNIEICCNGKIQQGEVVVTQFGLEGNGIYALSNEIQTQLGAKNKAIITIDFKPAFTETEILFKLSKSKEKKTTEKLRKDLKLSNVQIDLLKAILPKEDFLNNVSLAKHLKSVPIEIIESAPIDDAISTFGGIDLKEVNEHYELKKMPKTFCIGEMLNWDAPTGGYLLQACFSMGAHLGKHLTKKEGFSNE